MWWFPVYGLKSKLSLLWNFPPQTITFLFYCLHHLKLHQHCSLLPSRDSAVSFILKMYINPASLFELSSTCSFLFLPKFLKRVSAFHFSSLILSLIHWNLSLHSASLWQFDGFSDFDNLDLTYVLLWIILELFLCSLEHHFLTYSSPLPHDYPLLVLFHSFIFICLPLKVGVFCVYSWSFFLFSFL